MQSQARKPRDRRKRQKGVAAVELALVLPLFVLLIFGMIDFGHLFFVTSTMNNAAREGARTAAVQNTVDAPALAAAVAAANRTLSASGLGPASCTICPVAEASVVNDALGTAFRVDVRLIGNFPNITGFSYILPGISDRSPFTQLNLSTHSVMRWELSP